jgi:ferredoxin-NADP reductase
MHRTLLMGESVTHGVKRLIVSKPEGFADPGVCIAAGAGVTPFIAILRDLGRKDQLAKHMLMFSNGTPADVICEQEYRPHLGERCVLFCTRDSAPGRARGRIDPGYLTENIEDFNQHFMFAVRRASWMKSTAPCSRSAQPARHWLTRAERTAAKAGV